MIFGTSGLFALLTLLTSFKFITCQLIPDTENCSTINNIEHCFITSGGKDGVLRQWQQARDLCSYIEGGLYSLPVLDNDDIRIAMERYMVQQELYLESIWTAGRIERLSNWTWLDGSLYNIGINPLPLNFGQFCAAKMNVKNGINFTNVDDQAKLICQFRGSTCDEYYRPPPGDRLPTPIVFPSPTDNSSCYVVFPRHNDYDKSTQKWYTARNICLQKKGDLADYNITLLEPRLLNSLNSEVGYYIGLRQHRLVWDPSNGNTSDIKETYFGSNVPSASGNASCIAVKLSGQWVWETRHCQNDKLQVVCHKATVVPSHAPQPTSGSDDHTVPPITYGGMVGVAVGACVFFVFAVVAAVLITYFIIKRNPCGPREDDIYADNVHNGEHHCNDEEDADDYVNAGQMQDDNPDGRNPYADGGPSRDRPTRY